MTAHYSHGYGGPQMTIFPQFTSHFFSPHHALRPLLFKRSMVSRIGERVRCGAHHTFFVHPIHTTLLFTIHHITHFCSPSSHHSSLQQKCGALNWGKKFGSPRNFATFLWYKLVKRKRSVHYTVLSPNSRHHTMVSCKEVWCELG